MDREIIEGGWYGAICMPVHPSIDSHPDIHECHALELRRKVQGAIDENKKFYIGYTSSVDNTYLVHTSPKGKAHKDDFQKEETHWADITGTGITEKNLIEEFRGLGLCTNGKAGKPDTEGYLYILKGQKVDQPRGSSTKSKQKAYSEAGNLGKTSTSNGTKSKSSYGREKQPTSSTSSKGKPTTGQVKQQKSPAYSSRGKSSSAGPVKQPTSSTKCSTGKHSTGRLYSYHDFY